jgi:catechol 2,3-dioxygenase-like lactoylglutathione lyase family enzyme
MFGYIMVGTNDLVRSVKFYNQVFDAMGWEQCSIGERYASWGESQTSDSPRFYAGYPYDRNPATASNGSMSAFVLTDAATIQCLYEVAMGAGGTSEGEPGLRPQVAAGFYAAYVRDPDGNKLAFVCYDA